MTQSPIFQLTLVFTGGNCSDPVEFVPLLKGSSFVERPLGRWALSKCPPGYHIGVNGCSLCPATCYCTGGSNSAFPCGTLLFSLPGSSSREQCRTIVYVIITVFLPIPRQTINDEISYSIQRSIGNVADLEPTYALIVTICQHYRV